MRPLIRAWITPFVLVLVLSGSRALGSAGAAPQANGSPSGSTRTFAPPPASEEFVGGGSTTILRRMKVTAPQDRATPVGAPPL